MKTVTMDFKEYKEELNHEHYRGYRAGLGEARRIFLEMIAGATDESILQNYDGAADEDSDVQKLVKDLRPRFEMFKERARK